MWSSCFPTVWSTTQVTPTKQRLVYGSRPSSILSFRDSAWLNAWPLHRNGHGCKQKPVFHTNTPTGPDWRPVHSLIMLFRGICGMFMNIPVWCDSLKILPSSSVLFAMCSVQAKRHSSAGNQAAFIFTASDRSINRPLILWSKVEVLH